MTDETIAEVREILSARGIQMRPKTDPAMIAKILGVVEDADLAATAIGMVPRPAWVRELIGGDLMRVEVKKT